MHRGGHLRGRVSRLEQSVRGRERKKEIFRVTLKGLVLPNLFTTVVLVLTSRKFPLNRYLGQ